MPTRNPVPTPRKGLAGMLARLRAAPLPFATGGLSAAVGAGFCWTGAEALAEGAAAALHLLPATGWLGLAALCGADGCSRYRDYRRIKAMLGRWGFRPRLVRCVAGSRCQRDAALRAAAELGLAAQVRAYFRSLGYRWYHLLPDRVAERPASALEGAFLRSTFLGGVRRWPLAGAGRARRAAGAFRAAVPAQDPGGEGDARTGRLASWAIRTPF